MAGFIKIDAERVATTALNTEINKNVFDAFKIRCKQQGYPMNVVLETFMQQYRMGNFKVNEVDILKWKKDTNETDTLNTTFNREIYLDFKRTCKSNGYFVKYVLMAFMGLYADGELILGFVNV